MVWQPLSTWAEKFRYEFAASSDAPIAFGLTMFDALGRHRPRDHAPMLRPVLVAAYLRSSAAQSAVSRARELVPAIRADRAARFSASPRSRMVASFQPTRSLTASWRWSVRSRSRGRRRQADPAGDRLFVAADDHRLRDLARVDAARRARGQRKSALPSRPRADRRDRRFDARDGAVSR